jgi:hypothetical protein
MAKGYNKARTIQWLTWAFESEDVKKRPCVFLSHKSEDKAACRIIAEYFKDAEIDYYLDENDEILQSAAIAGDSFLITESIKKGIRASTHMLVVISEKTFTSPWIPFEIGYGHAAIIDKGLDEGKHADIIKLAVLTLKNISETPLPDFMKTAYIIRGTKSLNEYIAKLTHEKEEKLISEARMFSNTKSVHPLDTVLNWKL